MTTRWEVTKAVRGSDLPAPSRLVMLVLADVAKVGTAEIPARYTPSLTVLAAETGLDRSTVRRHLASLEGAGWVVRIRPDIAAARATGERTRYRLTVPRGFQPRRSVGAESPQVGAESPQVGAESPQSEPSSGGTVPPEVGAENTTGRGTVPLNNRSTDQDQIKEPSSSAMPPKASTKKASKPKNEEPPRLDVERICTHLADRIEGNGSRRPTVTEKWRTEARLLLDKDGRTVEQVLAAIDWCQADSFWCSVVMSMPKLREKYDQLRLAAKRQRDGQDGNRSGNGGHQPYRNPSDSSVYEGRL